MRSSGSGHGWIVSEYHATHAQILLLPVLQGLSPESAPAVLTAIEAERKSLQLLLASYPGTKSQVGFLP